MDAFPVEVGYQLGVVFWAVGVFGAGGLALVDQLVTSVHGRSRLLAELPETAAGPDHAGRCGARP